MIFILLGIGVLIAGFQFSNANFPQNRFGTPMKIGGVALAIFGVLTSCFVTIQPGEVGVQVLFGKVQERTLPSGLHFINPLVKVEQFNIKTQNYTMSSVHDEGDKMGDDAIRVLAADGLEVTIDLTVLYRVVETKAPDVLKEIGQGYREVIVRPVTRTKIRDNAVNYDAVSLYSTKRDEFQAKIFDDIQKLFRSRGLELEQLLVRNITLPNSVKETIESKINAEQESQKMQFVLAKEKQEADRKRVEAQGIADYQKIISTNLTGNQLQYELIKAQKELALSPNAKIVIMGGGNKDMPLILNHQ
jgi:regulator of protease activity HflC (stomatin/prohibitin superfamily)